MNDTKSQYLQMLENVISRMSTTSAIYKGFSATLMGTMTSLAIQNAKFSIFVIQLIIILIFAGMDIYYLHLERKYRAIYELTRMGEYKNYFNMEVSLTKQQKKLQHATILDSLKSFSISMFYYPLIIMCIVIMIYFK